MSTTPLTETLAGLNDEVMRHLQRDERIGVATCGGIEIMPMGDGSGRWCALLRMHVTRDCTEYTVRVATPAPVDAPAWASVHTNYQAQIVTAT